MKLQKKGLCLEPKELHSIFPIGQKRLKIRMVKSCTCTLSQSKKDNMFKVAIKSASLISYHW